ncbi:MAG: phosphoenolpyruvate--protein phosphotransferase [Deltaproteobacteria bacterium]|nr:phosphoenolpyruvate--protein phosphotransferase [Deltaproteobacteria bacterium]
MKSNFQVLNGIPASAGIAIGKAVLLERRKIDKFPRIRIPERLVEEEIERFNAAVEASYNQVEKAKQKLEEQDVIKEHSFILETHLMMLKDPAFTNRVKYLIRKRLINAEWALKIALMEIEESFDGLGDEYIKSRAADTTFVGDRILRNLTGKEIGHFHIPENSIIIAHDLSPADTAMLNKKRVLGFATDIGGLTSHTAIIARSLEIPAVVGLETVSLSISPGALLILDGITGTVIVNPSESQVEDYRHRAESYITYELKIKERACEPAVTLDGYHVSVEGNLEFKEEVHSVLEHGAEGIGLYRTEFIYLNRDDIPTEDDHFEAYKTVVEAVTPYNTIIRTLDLGGDKFYSVIGNLQKEMNPAMGLRAIRFCLKEVNIFKTQLRGILKASNYGKVSIMFPMISGFEELSRAKDILEEVKEELRQQDIAFDEQIKVGIMIEIPSAAIISDILAKEVDFFSIGTNDLIQYAIAIDRRNEYVDYLYEPLHPAVLRLIKYTIDAAHKEGITVGMCGEMAGRSIYTPILLGLGIDSLSTNALAIPHVKDIARRINLKRCMEITSHILDMRTANDVREFMNNEVKNSPELSDIVETDRDV